VSEKKKRGRKSSFNAKVQETIVRLIEEGKTEDQIAEIIGVSRTTLNNWKGKHPELLYAVREARQVADELVEAALFARAVGYSHPEQKVFQYEGQIITHEMVKHYPPDTAAASFWLRNRQPKRWKDKTSHEHSGPEGKPIEFSDHEAAAKLAAILNAAASRKSGGE
jgi:DNA-binding XRE family transcriptional regulator